MHDARPIDSMPVAIRWMDTVLDALAAICRLVTGVALVVLTVIFGWLVYGRYVLNATPTWVEQVALLLVMVIAFLGAAAGVHASTHLSVTALRGWAPPWLRLVFVILTDLMLGTFGFLMLWFGAKLTIFKWSTMIPLIQLPEGLRSLPLTIGGGLILLFSLGHLLRLALGHDQRSDEIV
ncbi:MAG: TRAP transporter small permease [Alphaproteobacteria bacterium]|nr:MAG: TRAP transporter small permease [Alphaproteobacteria bacterium]